MINYYAAPALIPSYKMPGVTYSQTRILLCVSEYLNVPVVEMLSKKRDRPISEARFLAMFFIKRLTGISLKSIATIFNCHHSSIIHAIHTVDDLMRDPEFKKKVQHLSQLITPTSLKSD